jgi:hypothetical protein
MSSATKEPLRMALTALSVEAARVVGAAFIHALSPFMPERKRLIQQRLFHVPVTLLCADGEFEIFARYGVPVLHEQSR